MGVGQVTYPQTAIFGTSFIKGRPEKIDVVVEVSQRPDATKSEKRLIDNTVGFLSLMIAAKTIGVEMATIDSFDSRLFDLAFTFSKAGVHTTQINPISEQARAILTSTGINWDRSHVVRERLLSHDFARLAMHQRSIKQDPGGIDMNSRLLNLKESGDTMPRFDLGEGAVSANIINAVVPQVSHIITVTPAMLKTMLGPGYLN